MCASAIDVKPKSKPKTQPSPRVAPAVRSCYDVLDVCTYCGISDFTDGKYIDPRNDRQTYLAAQRRQADYLLDQIDCGPGKRILDIGCGYGRILEAAVGRGAEAVGITISPPQVDSCRRRELEVYQCNCRDIFSSPTCDGWEGTFDGIVANGSLEHFVQAEDAAAGRDNEMYRELFAICRRLLKPGGKFVTTAIHASREGQVDPEDIMKDPASFLKHTDDYHAANLYRSFGGWFPVPRQLEWCAAGDFDLIAEEDGTHDYHMTSEYWLWQLKRSFALSPSAWWALGRSLLRFPWPTISMLRCLMWDQSWNYQFRAPAPTRLLRQTWQAV